MKKMLLLVMCLLLVIGCKKNEINDEVPLIPLSYFPVLNDTERSCNEEINAYFEYNNIKYYIVCIDYIGVVFEDTRLFLDIREAFERKVSTLENIMAMCDSRKNIKGYNVYYYKKFNFIVNSNKSKVYFLSKDIDIGSFLVRIK